MGTIWTTLIFFMIATSPLSPICRRDITLEVPAETIAGRDPKRGQIYFSIPSRLAHCAINKPKKNHVGFRSSQVRLETPTTQTPRITIQNLRGREGIALTDSPRTPSKAQKSVKPITPCSTRTDRKVLCATIGSDNARLTLSRNPAAPTPRKGCIRKSSQPAVQMTVRPVSVPCRSSLGIVERRSQEVEGKKASPPQMTSAVVKRVAILRRRDNSTEVKGTIENATTPAKKPPLAALSKMAVPAKRSWSP